MARRGRAIAPIQQLETLGQPFDQRLDRQGFDIRRGQFKGQGQAIQLAAELGHGRGIGRGQLKSRLCQGGARHKQTHRLIHQQVSRGGVCCGRRHGQRRHLIALFTNHAQRLATGGQKAHLRTTAQYGGGQVRARGQEMFTVVEDQH